MLNPAKAFIRFPSVKLLEQNVTSLSISAPTEHLEALAKLKFLETLADLSTYLGITGFLQNYIPYYAAKAQPLHDQKIYLVNLGPAKGRP
jgi:hypothetical protein